MSELFECPECLFFLGSRDQKDRFFGFCWDKCHHWRWEQALWIDWGLALRQIRCFFQLHSCSKCCWLVKLLKFHSCWGMRKCSKTHWNLCSMSYSTSLRYMNDLIVSNAWTFHCRLKFRISGRSWRGWHSQCDRTWEDGRACCPMRQIYL